MIAPNENRKPLRLDALERRWGLVLIAPWLIGLLLFYIGPLLYSLVLSFTDYNLVENTGKFVGLKNWLSIFIYMLSRAML